MTDPHLTTRDAVRASFEGLEFAFTETRAGRQRHLIGFAPDGRTGIVEVAQTPGEVTSTLLLSASTDDQANAVWSGVCLGSLSSALGVDFHAWLGRQLGNNGSLATWSVHAWVGDNRVSASFFPVDSMVITVQQPRAARSAD